MRASEQFRIYGNSPVKYIVDFFIDHTLKQITFEELGHYIEEIKTGKTPAKKENKYWNKDEYNWFKPEDVGFDIYLEDSTDKLSLCAIEEGQATIYQPNTLLITGIGDLGRLGILKKESSSNQQITGVLFNNKVLPEFAYFYLLSMKDQLNDKSSQTTLPILNQKKLSSVKIKIPPIEIQKEFVKFMMHCWSCLKENKLPEAEYPKDKDLTSFAKKSFLTYFGQKEMININNYNESNIAKLRASILQSAVQGNLVKQDPKDGPASELLKKIKAEKEKLIKEGKIRKDKPIASISKDEIPYELPKGWEWVRLGELLEFAENLDIQKKLSPTELINYVDIDSIDNLKFRITEPKKEMVANLSSRARRILKKDFMLYSLVRPYLNNIAFVEKEEENMIGSTGFAVFKPILIDKKYIFYFLLNPILRNYYLDFMKGFNSPGISFEIFNNTPFPLPPITEQKRIAEKVDKLMAYCDDLEKQVKENQENAEKLMSAVLKEGFEE